MKTLERLTDLPKLKQLINGRASSTFPPLPEPSSKTQVGRGSGHSRADAGFVFETEVS